MHVGKHSGLVQADNSRRNKGEYKSPRVQPTIVSVSSRMGLGLEDAVDYCHCSWKA